MIRSTECRAVPGWTQRQVAHIARESYEMLGGQGWSLFSDKVWSLAVRAAVCDAVAAREKTTDPDAITALVVEIERLLGVYQ